MRKMTLVILSVLTCLCIGGVAWAEEPAAAAQPAVAPAPVTAQTPAELLASLGLDGQGATPAATNTCCQNAAFRCADLCSPCTRTFSCQPMGTSCTYTCRCNITPLCQPQ
jgi:hypothetical protein